MHKLEFYDRTTLHPLGLLALVVLSALTLGAKRENLLLGFLLLATFVAPAQRVVIGGLDFTLFRLLVLVGWARLVARGEANIGKLTRLDTWVVAWTMTNTLAFIALHGDFGAVVNRGGRLFDFLGMYFYARVALRDVRDVQRVALQMSWIVIPVAAMFLYERSTGHNPFHLLGGVPERTIAREGRLRCQGPFPHPILAGWFWASWLPLFLALGWTRRKLRPRAIVAAVAVVMIAIANSSSTPMGGLGAIGLALFLFPMRRQFPALRAGIAVLLVFLHLVMSKPVWHLVSRIDLAGGSTGFHRFNLIDQTIKRFPEWALVGTKSTAHWGLDLWDTANQYVAEAVTGGFLGLVFFTCALVTAFGDLGRALRRTRRRRDQHRWCYAVGVTLFAQCAMFVAISISYSQQATMTLMIVLAATQCVGRPLPGAAPAPLRASGVAAQRGPTAVPRLAPVRPHRPQTA